MRRILVLAGWLSTALGCCSAVLGSAPEFDSFRGWRRLWGEKTGYFHTEIIRGRFWLIDPEGNGFIVLGAEAGAEQDGSQNVSASARDALNCLVRRGAQTEFPYILPLGLGPQALSETREVTPGFPDVFSPAFERVVDRASRQQCTARRSDPFLVGYILDDSMPWGGRSGSAYGLAIDFLKLSADDPGKKAVVEVLRRRHGDDVASVASALGATISSWQEALEKTDWDFGGAADMSKVAADLGAIVGAIAARYSTVCCNALRRYDPNHLIFSAPFPGWAPRGAALAVGDAVDAFCAQMQEGERLAFLPIQLYRDSAKPTLLVGMPRKGGAKLLQKAVSLPFIIGFVLPKGEQPADGRVEPFYTAAARGKALVSFRQPIPRYDLRKRKAPITIDARLEDWEGAVPIELEVSPYSPPASNTKATLWLMWDDNHIYMAGRVAAEERQANTLTSFVGDDSVELLAGKARILISLRPGRQFATVGEKEPRRADVVVRPIFAQEEARRIVGYTFEAAAEVPIPVPPGFVYRFGVVFRSKGPGGAPVVFSYPPTLAADDPETQAEFVLAAPSP